MAITTFNHEAYRKRGGFKGTEYLEYLEAQHAHYQKQFDEITANGEAGIENPSDYFTLGKRLRRLEADIAKQKRQ
ncbi:MULTISPECIES: hypothetical protein [unclassified Exiguobacterium]|uniref:hypothetical protein n=1 Tax=unclassified Exiguobacterium TaxID=2644629 RepID=UPI001BEA7DAA|nr:MULTISPECIES: hypothetical protein [unclassified Exiguobacterium]